MEICGLLFDMSGVLYDDSAWNRWLLQLLQRMGLHTHYDAFCVLCRHELSNSDRDEYWPALRAFLQSTGLTKAQIEEVEAAGYSRWRQARRQLRPFPGVTRTLNLLGQLKVPMGIVAHCDHDNTDLQQSLSKLTLADHFRVVESFRRADDARLAFNRAWLRLGVDQRRGAYIASDSAALRAARQHCGRLIAFNTGDSVVAHARLQKFQELPELTTGMSTVMRTMAG